MINTAAEARSVVSLARFPPAGVRGQGSPFACLEHGLATPSEYVNQSNESVVIMVQIETAAGVNNIDEICQVDGIGKFPFFVPQSEHKKAKTEEISRSCIHRPE